MKQKTYEQSLGTVDALENLFYLVVQRNCMSWLFYVKYRPSKCCMLFHLQFYHPALTDNFSAIKTVNRCRFNNVKRWLTFKKGRWNVWASFVIWEQGCARGLSSRDHQTKKTEATGSRLRRSSTNSRRGGRPRNIEATSLSGRHDSIWKWCWRGIKN